MKNENKNEKKCAYCNKKVADINVAKSCNLCKSLYHESCSARVALNEAGGYIKCCGDIMMRNLGILDKEKELNSSVVDSQKDRLITELSNSNNQRGGNMIDNLKAYFNKSLNMINNNVETSYKNLSKHITEEVNRVQESIKKLEYRVDENEKQMKDMIKKVNDYDEKISRIECLDNEIKVINEKIDEIENDGSGQREGDHDGMNDEIIIREMRERIMKEKNVIIFNVKENMNYIQDINEVKQILKEIIDVEQIQITRLGKSNEGKVRPIRVRCNSSDEVIKILKQNKNFKNGIYCTNDKTAKERDTIKNLKEKYKLMREAGNTNIALKYVKGILTIIENKENENAS